MFTSKAEQCFCTLLRSFLFSLNTYQYEIILCPKFVDFVMNL
jgi:hypothetical protein